MERIIITIVIAIFILIMASCAVSVLFVDKNVSSVDKDSPEPPQEGKTPTNP